MNRWMVWISISCAWLAVIALIILLPARVLNAGSDVALAISGPLALILGYLLGRRSREDR